MSVCVDEFISSWFRMHQLVRLHLALGAYFYANWFWVCETYAIALVCVCSVSRNNVKMIPSLFWAGFSLVEMRRIRYHFKLTGWYLNFVYDQYGVRNFNGKYGTAHLRTRWYPRVSSWDTEQKQINRGRLTFLPKPNYRAMGWGRKGEGEEELGLGFAHFT